MDLREGMATMSFHGTSLGVPLRGLDATGLRTVIYVNILPNVLLSLHPDYVMTHRLTPLAADRTRIECTWAFAHEAVDGPASTPATRWSSGTSPTARLGRVRVRPARLASPRALPGPLAPTRPPSTRS